MGEIIVQLPEPIITRLREQALKADVSLVELVSQRLMEGFDLAVCTEGQARRRVLKLLREHAGYMFRTGTPTFEANAFVWRVPVFPNLKRGKQEPVGEVHLKADTGEILTEPLAILEMSDKVAPLLDVERFDESFQKRIAELLNKNNNGELSPAERRLLENMVQKTQVKDRENIQRLIERLRLPKANREAALAALERASAVLENAADEPKEDVPRRINSSGYDIEISNK
ncbi:hypothetical protein FJZ31_40020 [Candidatus Poribacteria bacterium]|nr:hypothetical protein [Candidatus Poribacteria bacterium]